MWKARARVSSRRRSFQFSPQYFDLLALSKLDQLTSLEIRTCDKYDCKQVQALFQAVYERKKLEHFETDAIIPAEHICKALSICKNLRRLAVHSLDSSGYSAICKTMLSSHKDEILPKTVTDSRILQIRVASYGSLKCDYPDNAWIKIGGEYEAGVFDHPNQKEELD
uniref:Uncharacterized protein n=1 Tax=Ditylenchus dipsaci TaxID=166011 RepID=A0A915D644_9BILA